MTNQVSASSVAECLQILGVKEKDTALVSVENRDDSYSDETRAIEEGLPLNTVFEKTTTIYTVRTKDIEPPTREE